ncbi:MAG TPA: hypothetical protein VFA48_10885 [Gammaproteobacteria bacterium]|nr:hypothetical protein [Gammaproteobacteria bacterium]
MRSTEHEVPAAGRIPLLLALICYGAYAVDIIVAKLASVVPFAWPYELGSVAQFMIVLAGSALLVVAALMLEARQADT